MEAHRKILLKVVKQEPRLLLTCGSHPDVLLRYPLHYSASRQVNEAVRTHLRCFMRGTRFPSHIRLARSQWHGPYQVEWRLATVVFPYIQDKEIGLICIWWNRNINDSCHIKILSILRGWKKQHNGTWNS